MKVVLSLLLVLSVVANFGLLIFVLGPCANKTQQVSPQITRQILNQVREISVLCGTPKAQAERENAEVLLARVRKFLENAEYCDAITLPQSEWEYIEIAIGVKKNLFIIIKDQNRYITRLSGKRFLILPPKSK